MSISVKEQVIRESIARIEKRLPEIIHMLNANPLAEIIQLRQELQNQFKTYENNLANPEFGKWLKWSSAKEKELFALSKVQIEQSSDLISERVKLENELGNLKTELYWIENKR